MISNSTNNFMVMKKYLIYIFFFPLLATLFNSCEEDLLNLSNPSALTSDSYWNTKDDFNKALNAMYTSMEQSAVSGSGLINDMQRSDEAGTETWYNTDFAQLKWSDGNQYVIDRWSQLYIGIFRANQILYYIDKTDIFTEDEANIIKGQARFLRALDYFYLTYTYNGAVINDVMPQTPDEMQKPFENTQSVVTKVIIPDLEFAASVLPEKWTNTSDIGRFTWGAATTMLGKTYLYQNDWANAKKYLGQVITEAEASNLYTLVPNYMDNFTVDNEFNSESILEVAYSDNYKPGTSGNNHDEKNGSNATSIASAFASITGAGGYNTVLPSYWIQELFVSADSVDRTNSVNTNFHYSQRTYATIAVERGDGDYYQAPLLPYVDATGKTITSKANFSYGQGSKVKKWTSWDRVPTENTTTNARSGINFRLIRYADVLLMYAEAVLKNSGDVPTAIKYIDQVRSRAGVVKLQSFINSTGTFPRFDVSKFANGLTTYPNVTPSADNVLQHLRMVERPLELAFEGQRWYDLVRWGIIKQVFTDRYAEENGIRTTLHVASGAETIPATQPKIYPLYLNQRVRPDFLKKLTNYSAGGRDYLPVPDIEVQTNKLLNSNN